MALDWSNERYVRLYTRITPDMALWCWQAKAIWPWLLAAADRSGIIAARKGPRAIAVLLGMPLEVVSDGLHDLLEDGCIVATESGYAIPNYADAQTAVASVNKRVADHRARQRLDSSIANRSDANNDVTPEHAPVTGVTPSGAGRDVTERDGTDPETPAAPAQLAIGTVPDAKPVKQARKRSAISLPDDFAPDDGHRSFAATNRLDLDRELERFKLHHAAKGSVFASWSAALGTWLRNAVEFRARGGDGPGGPRTRAPTGLAATAEILAERAAAGAFVDPFKPRGNL